MKKLVQTLSLTTILVCAAGAVQAQSTDTIRIMQLEENVRHLNGQVEELRFQLLQMQEAIRKTQEDNEFRFQELEEKSDASGVIKDNRLGKLPSSDASNTEKASDDKDSIFADLLSKDEKKTNERRTIDGVEIFDPNKDKSGDEIGSATGVLGSIIFDSAGNLIDNNGGEKPIQLVPGATASSSKLGDLPKDENELFDLGYQYFLGSEFTNAAQVFETYSSQFPDGRRISNANFWLAESLFSLRRYEDSARVYLNNHREFPEGQLAPQNLLKLGVSLAAMNQRELACATYAQVPKLYPKANRSVQDRVEVEQRSAKCKG